MSVKDDEVVNAPKRERPALQIEGLCPISQRPARLTSDQHLYRDWLRCEHCRSNPRERALALVLEEPKPDWRARRSPRACPHRITSLGISTVLRPPTFTV